MSPRVDDTFAEAFPMTATRLIITAYEVELARQAAGEFCGNASSVIGCDAEAGIERIYDASETPDGRPGVSVLAFAFSRKQLEKAVTERVGQNILTCPTTGCYSGIDSEPAQRIKLGAQLRYFGDGFQIAKKFQSRRYWRVPVMDGEFVCDDVAGTTKGVGGGNLLLTGRQPIACLRAAQAAVEAMREIPDVVLPFPAGIVRSGSKVGSKYPQLKASTNHAWCPSLRGLTQSELDEEENVVYEIVIDGLSQAAVARAMQAGIDVLKANRDVLRISAGNYGGKLGPYHFHLLRLEGV